MSDITVIIPVCAMPSHPETYVLDETLDSIFERLPDDTEVILMFDGLSPTLIHFKTAYDQYVQHMLTRIESDRHHITPVLFTEHNHQSLMTKKALEIVRTPLLLWSEQDTPLHNDIPFAELSEVVTYGYANVIRFHHEATIPEDHKSLMLDEAPIDILGQPFIRTMQWSGRPHLASTEYYRYIADKYWDDQPRFIEHIMYGTVVEGAFDEHRLHIYAPDGTFVRHKHTDGRRTGANTYDPRPS